jgi:hypothetical protein
MFGANICGDMQITVGMHSPLLWPADAILDVFDVVAMDGQAGHWPPRYHQQGRCKGKGRRKHEVQEAELKYACGTEEEHAESRCYMSNTCQRAPCQDLMALALMALC